MGKVASVAMAVIMPLIVALGAIVMFWEVIALAHLLSRV